MNWMILALGVLLVALMIYIVYKVRQNPKGKKAVAVAATALTIAGAGMYAVTPQALVADDFFTIEVDNTPNCGGPDSLCKGAFVFKNSDIKDIKIEDILFDFEYLNGSDASSEIISFTVAASEDSCHIVSPPTSTVEETTTTTTASGTADYEIHYIKDPTFPVPNNTRRAGAYLDTDLQDKCKDVDYDKMERYKISPGETVLIRIEAEKSPDATVDWKPYIDIEGAKLKQDKWDIWGMVDTSTGVSTSPFLYYPFERYGAAPTVNGSSTYAQYHLDSNPNDGSGNGRNGVVTGATAGSVACKYNTCYGFDGTEDRIDTQFAPPSTGCTVAWANISSGTLAGSVDGSLNRWYMGRLVSTTLYMGWGDSATALSADYTDYVGVLTHIAQCWDGSDGWLYINGKQVDTQSISGTISPQNVYIGGVNNNDASQDQDLTGTVDEFLWYDYVLEDEEINQLYLGSTAIDQSGSGNDGTIEGAYNTSGVRGGGIRFNASSEWMISVSGAYPTSSAGTICAWINSTNLAARETIYSLADTDSTSYYFIFRVGATTQVEFLMNDGGGPDGIRDPETYVSGELRHSCVTTDGSRYKMYRNGEEITFTQFLGVDSGNWWDDLTSTDVHLVGIGELSTGLQYPFGGMIDELRTYEFELTPKQIKGLYELNADTLKVNDPDNATYANASAIPQDVDVQVGVPADITVGYKAAGTINLNDVQGYYLFDNDDIRVDSSGNGNDIAVDTITQQWSGIYGRSARFNGIDSAMQTSVIDATGNGLTLSAWVNVDNNPDNQKIISSKSDGNINTHISVTNQDVIQAFVRNEASTSAILNYESSGVRYTGWHMLTLTHIDGAMNLYVDGVLVAQNTTSITGNVMSGNEYFIGNGYQTTGTLFDVVNGSIDEVVIANRTFSQTEIFELYKRTKISYLDEDTILYADMEEYGAAPTVNGSGTTAQYHLDGNAGDGSGNGYTGTVTGASASTTTCKYDGCYDFDGTSDYILVCDEPTCTWADDFDTTGFTSCGWFNFTTGLIENQVVVAQWDATSDDKYWRFLLDYDASPSPKISGAFYDDGGTNFYSTGQSEALSVDTYYHGCIGYDPVNNVGKAWVNGVALADSSTFTATWSDTEDVYIGANDDGAQSNSWHGSIDEVLFYSRILSDEEVNQLYLGSDMIDHSNSENTGSISGAYNVSGKYGSGMNCTGSDSIKLPANILDNETFSYSAWIKPRSNDALSQIVNFKDDYSTQILLWESTDASYPDMISVDIDDGPTTVRIFSESLAVLEEWIHVATTYDGVTLRLYINGVLEKEALSNAPEPLDLGSRICSRYDGTTQFFDGIVDNVIAANRVWSSKEIKNMYNADLRWQNDTHWTLNGDLDVEDYGEVFYDFETTLEAPTVNDSGQLAQYHLDGNVADGTSNGYDGTLTGSPASVAGKYGSSYNFTADASEYITACNEPSCTYSKSMCDNGCSVCTWLKPRYRQGNSQLMGRFDTANDDRFWFLNYLDDNGVGNDQQFSFRVYGDGTSSFSASVSSTAQPQDEWVHVCGIYDGSTSAAGNTYIYLNGKLDATSAGTVQIDGTAWDDDEDLLIGAIDDSSYTPANGTIDEVLFYNRTLSAEEINQLYMGSKTKDASLNINTGDISGAYNTSGKYGSGMRFVAREDGITAGAGDHILADQNGDSFGKTMCDAGCSFCSWINTDGAVLFQSVMARHDNLEATDLEFFSMNMNTDLQQGFTLSGEGETPTTIIDATPVTPGEWVHYCATSNISKANAGHLMLYRNGVRVNTSDSPTASAITSQWLEDESFYIGANRERGLRNYWNGSLDDVGVYTRELSAAEVLGIYNERSPRFGSHINLTYTACNTAGFCTSELRMTAIGNEAVNITVWDGAEYVSGTDIQFRCTPTQTDCAATNQGASDGIYNMMNNGTFTADLDMKLQATCTDIDIKCDTDNNPTGATSLTTAYQNLATDIAADASQEVWCWADYSDPSSGCQFNVEVQYTHTPS